jgi:hypothetical protein
MKSLRYPAMALMLLSLAAAPMDDIGAMIGRADTLMKSVVYSLNAAGELSGSDRQAACQQARLAQSQLSELGQTIDAISGAVQSDSSLTADDRASWATMADKMTDFVKRRRETAMDDWQKLC